MCANIDLNSFTHLQIMAFHNFGNELEKTFSWSFLKPNMNGITHKVAFCTKNICCCCSLANEELHQVNMMISDENFIYILARILTPRRSAAWVDMLAYTLRRLQEKCDNAQCKLDMSFKLLLQYSYIKCSFIFRLDHIKALS